MMMPNSMLLPTVASEKSDCDAMPTNLRTEGSGKYSGIPMKTTPAELKHRCLLIKYSFTLETAVTASKKIMQRSKSGLF